MAELSPADARIERAPDVTATADSSTREATVDIDVDLPADPLLVSFMASMVAALG